MADPEIIRRFGLRIDYGLSPDEMLNATGCEDVAPSLCLHPSWGDGQDVAHVTAVLIIMKRSYQLGEIPGVLDVLGARAFRDNGALWVLSDRQPRLQMHNGIVDPGKIWDHPVMGHSVAVLSGNPDGSRGAGLSACQNVWQERCLVLAEIP